MRVQNEQCTPEEFKLAFELLIANCTVRNDKNQMIIIQKPTIETLANFIKLAKTIK